MANPEEHDIGLFAEKYIGIKLSPYQIQILKAAQDGKLITEIDIAEVRRINRRIWRKLFLYGNVIVVTGG